MPAGALCVQPFLKEKLSSFSIFQKSNQPRGSYYSGENLDPDVFLFVAIS